MTGANYEQPSSEELSKLTHKLQFDPSKGGSKEIGELIGHALSAHDTETLGHLSLMLIKVATPGMSNGWPQAEAYKTVIDAYLNSQDTETLDPEDASSEESGHDT
jgi:hypothetical protein